MNDWLAYGLGAVSSIIGAVLGLLGWALAQRRRITRYRASGPARLNEAPAFDPNWYRTSPDPTDPALWHGEGPCDCGTRPAPPDSAVPAPPAAPQP